MRYLIRLSGNAPVYADVQVEAASLAEALDAVLELNPAATAPWARCGDVDDWGMTGDIFQAVTTSGIADLGQMNRREPGCLGQYARGSDRGFPGWGDIVHTAPLPE